jgi:glycine cleavage system protein P-like pyridoxal-binding family
MKSLVVGGCGEGIPPISVKQCFESRIPAPQLPIQRFHAYTMYNNKTMDMIKNIYSKPNMISLL